MRTKSHQTLIDIAAFLAMAWMWIAISDSFTRSGMWPIVDRALGGSTTLPSLAVVLATCVLAGWVAIALFVSLVNRFVLANRPLPNFPVARIRSS